MILIVNHGCPVQCQNKKCGAVNEFNNLPTVIINIINDVSTLNTCNPTVLMFDAVAPNYIKTLHQLCTYKIKYKIRERLLVANVGNQFYIKINNKNKSKTMP